MMTEDNDETDTNKASKSGSETRKSSCLVGVRFHPDVHAKLVADADAMKISPASYLRWCYDSTPPPRQARRPSVEEQEVARLTGVVGKAGSNWNQIAKHMNSEFQRTGDPAIGAVLARVDAACDDIAAIRDACLKALGRKS